MSQVNKKLLIIGFILVVIMGVSGIYALADGGSNESSLSAGNIDIKIMEYTLNSDNEEIMYNEQNQIVEYGQIISLIEKVRNLGAECYIRVNITMEGANVTECIQGFSEDWQKIGPYYYYKKKVNTNDEIKIFDTVKIPNALPDTTYNQITLAVVVDAIQTRNFEPNYESEDPWNGIEIEKSIYNSYDIDGDTNKYTIEYEDGCNKYISVSDDFLQDFSRMLPGDSVQKQITIKNTKKEQAEFLLAIDINNLTEEQKALLTNIPVKIMNKDGNIVYDGSLAGLAEEISLGIYKLNEEDVLTIKIMLPKEAKNEYEGILQNIKWRFFAKYNEQENNSKNVKTGDFEFDLSLILFFTSATGLVVVLALMHAERKKNMKNI